MQFIRSISVGAGLLGALGLAAALVAAPAQARDNVYWSVGVHAAPGVSVGVGNYRPPVYVQPAPVYVPPPVYVQPQPVYVPRPIYVQPAPVYVQPAPVYYGPGYYGKPHHRKPHRHHKHRHHDDD